MHFFLPVAANAPREHVVADSHTRGIRTGAEAIGAHAKQTVAEAAVSLSVVHHSEQE